MKLNIIYSEEEIDVAFMIQCDFINVLYDLNMPILETLNSSKQIIKKEVNEELRTIMCEDTDLIEEEKNYYLDKINGIKKSLDKGLDEFLDWFDKIEIQVEDIASLEKIDKLIKGITLPVVLNLKALPEDYLLENISKIDTNLKQNHEGKITYLINQCLSDSDAHYEDNSYTKEDVILVLSYIKNVIETVKQFNLSPLEQVMYVYDLVKNRSFIERAKGEDYIESRDLARILKSDKIVCLGFAVLMKALLDELKIENEIVVLSSINSNSGHARNMIVIKDEKYNLDHILFFDATWDSKNSSNGKDNVNKYDCFGKTKFQFDAVDSKKYKNNQYLPLYPNYKDTEFLKTVPFDLVKSKKVFRKIDWKKILEEDETISIDFEEKVDMLMNDKDPVMAMIMLHGNKDFEVKLYQFYHKILSRNLPSESFLRCLYTVRRIEHYINPQEYPFDRETILNTAYYYEYGYNEEQFFINKVLFNIDKIYEDQLQEIVLVKDIQGKNKINIDIERINFLSGLRTLANNINQQQIDENQTVKDAIKIVKK